MDKLLQRAISASKNAYAPYSKFHVGAAVELSNGEIITGTNQECASYSLSICAERVALSSALSQFPTARVKRIAVYSPQSPEGISPCGACREYLQECVRRSGEDIEVYGIRGSACAMVSELLPHAFIL